MNSKIIIVGAGLGGLTAAAALIRKGFAVEVLEQAPALGEVGAGLHVSPNAIRIFRELGLEDKIAAIANEPTSFSGFDWKSGRRLYKTPISDHFQTTYGTSYYTVYRPDLHAILVDAVPRSCIRVNARVTEVGQTDEAAFARLTTGEIVTGAVVIGADGIHSVVRRSIDADDLPRFTGMIAFRGIVPADKIPAGAIENVASNWMGPHGHIVHYFIRQQQLLNIVAIHENNDWTGESWSTPASHAEMLKIFSGWHPTIRHLLGATTHPFKWAVYDREPIARWSQGRVSLLGDAAHAMLPFVAQGAAMAIEDGWVLAQCFAKRQDDLVGALSDYERERITRTKRVQLASRARATSLHEPSKWRRIIRNANFKAKNLLKPRATMHQAEWIYSYRYPSP